MADIGVIVEPSADEMSADLEQKKAEVTEKLQKREDDRLAYVQKRKEEKESVTAEDESAKFFHSKFTTGLNAVETDLNQADGIGKASLVEHFDGLVVSLQKLQKFLSDSTMFLPSYDVQKSQEYINKMQADIQSKRDQLMPKKKFAFKSKKKTSEKVVDKPKEIVQRKTIQVDLNECNFADRTSETLTKTAEEATSKDVALANLSNCVVRIYGAPSAIHVNKLSGCKVFTGPVSGSIFIDNCIDCTFVLPCQQLRIHHTSQTDFYIHVTSRAIIEDCNTVKFAPYNWTYEGIDRHYEISGLPCDTNNWDDVDDFNWLSSDRHSPNWSVLPVECRVSEWDK